MAIGTVTVQISAGAAQDDAGNPSSSSNLLEVDFDDTPPPGGGDEHVADTNTVALYHFNANFADSTANQLDLSVSGGVQLSGDNLGWMGTPSGQVARFNAIGDSLSVSIPDDLMLEAGDPRPLTIEARIYPRAWLGYGIDNLSVITLEQDWDTNLTLEDSKWGTSPKGPHVLSAGIPITTAPQWAAAAPLDQWALVQISFDGSNTVSAWINGQPAGAVTIEPNVDRTADWILTLGNFAGDLDEVYIHRGPPDAADQSNTVISASAAVVAAAFAEDDGAHTGPAADPDGDHRSNLLEIALGTNPLLQDGTGIDVERAPDGEVTITFPVPDHAASTSSGYQSAAFNYLVQTSDDLETWTDCQVTPTGEEAMANDFRRVRMRIEPVLDSRQFFRLKVETR